MGIERELTYEAIKDQSYTEIDQVPASQKDIPVKQIISRSSGAPRRAHELFVGFQCGVPHSVTKLRETRFVIYLDSDGQARAANHQQSHKSNWKDIPESNLTPAQIQNGSFGHENEEALPRSMESARKEGSLHIVTPVDDHPPITPSFPGRKAA